MPLPKNPCPTCGVPYFPSAMKFHAAKCQQKQAMMVLPCPACGMELRKHELNTHMLKCAKANARGGGRAGSGMLGGGAAAATRPAMVLLPTDADGRVPCATCGRKFAPDRIAKHQYICSGLTHGPPKKPTGGGSGPRARLLGSSSSSPAPWISDFADTASPFDSPPRPLPGRSKPRTHGPPSPNRAPSRGGAYDGKPPELGQGRAWKSQSEELRAAMRAGRGLPPRPSQGRLGGGIVVGGGGYSGGGGGGGNGFAPCPHCHRTFAPQALERHVPSCKQTLNKPAPPPAYRACNPNAHRCSPSTSRPMSSSAARRGAGFGSAHGMGGSVGGGGFGCGGSGGGGATGGGGGGIENSLLTSYDNPLASMCSPQHTYHALSGKGPVASSGGTAGMGASMRGAAPLRAATSSYRGDVTRSGLTSSENPLAVMCEPQHTCRSSFTGGPGGFAAFPAACSHSRAPAALGSFTSGDPGGFAARGGASNGRAPAALGAYASGDVADSIRTSADNPLSAMCDVHHTYRPRLQSSTAPGGACGRLAANTRPSSSGSAGPYAAGGSRVRY